MRHLFITIATLAALTGNAYALENTVKPAVTSLKAVPKTGLYVGNSYTYFNCGVSDWLKGLTKATGQPWETRMTTISASYLSDHPVKAYLAPYPMDPFDEHSPKFDVVFLQGQSMEPITSGAIKEKYQSTFADHVKTIRGAGSEPAAIITWARINQPEQTQLLADSIISEANKNGVFAIPVGLAFAESLKGRPDLLLHQPDSHPSAAGSYLYGAVLYASLFKKSPEGIDFLGICEKPLNDADAKYLQSVAWKTVKDFYGWQE